MNKNAFCRMTGREMHELLTDLGYEPIQDLKTPSGAPFQEWVYGKRVGAVTLRVFTTIDTHTEIARPKGEDAIRVQPFRRLRTGRIIAIRRPTKATRVNRTMTWKRNLTKRIQEAERVLF